MIRVVTIGGEFGSGREEIGRGLADRLGWKLLDNALIEEIARTAHVDPAVALSYDESTDPWFHRLHKALWHGGYEGVVTTTEAASLDADAVAGFARRVIEEAARQGRCVIVGRGSQCVLQDWSGTFHVFVYAPLDQRIERVRRCSAPGSDPDAQVVSMDRRRQAYIRRYFGQDWTNHHLYDLMICSTTGEAAAIACILGALKAAVLPE